jgi:hypothetical protein
MTTSQLKMEGETSPKTLSLSDIPWTLDNIHHIVDAAHLMPLISG